MRKIKSAWSVPPVCPVLPDGALFFSDAGLSLGDRIVAPHPVTAFDEDGDEKARGRLGALLAIGFRKRLDSSLFRHLAEAAAYSRRCDQALANIRLAACRLSPIQDADDIVLRLDWADQLLSGGMTPQTLLKELGLADPSGLTRVYDPDQPRDPAGNGPESGRWTSAAAGSHVTADVPASVATASSLAVPAIAPELLPVLGGMTMTALSALAASLGFAATLGAFFVPWQKAVSSSGPLPGDESTRYDYNEDEGTLRLIDTTGGHPLVIAAGRKDADGVFWDVDTGIPIAQEVGGSLVFEGAALAAAADVSDKAKKKAALLRAAAVAAAKKNGDLCPDPSLDVPHGASPRAIAHQLQISTLNNPHRPLQAGLGVSLINPETNRRVVYDDCRDDDGAMIEAKGPGFANLLRSKYVKKVIKKRWENQAARQVQAAVDRAVEWSFADREAWDFANELSADNPPLARIIRHHIPAGFP